MENTVQSLQMTGDTPAVLPCDDVANATALGAEKPGFCGYIHSIDATQVLSSCPAPELERRLLEMGFIEGHLVEILHQGSFRGDPIAVRIGSSTVALRRCEAMAILVS
jgi:ferrous iron transport protein A